jgi:hypothetical protein
MSILKIDPQLPTQIPTTNVQTQNFVPVASSAKKTFVQKITEFATKTSLKISQSTQHIISNITSSYAAFADSSAAKNVREVLNYLTTSEETSPSFHRKPPVELQKASNFVRICVIDRRTLFDKIADTTQSTLNCAFKFVIMTRRRISTSKIKFAYAQKQAKTYSYNSNDFPWTTSQHSNGLYLLVHGLRGFPTSLQEYIQKIQHIDPQSHIFSPHVVKKGNCKLTTAAEPLLKVVQNYLEKFPGKQVTIIGHSNGGRIASYIETNLSPDLLGNSRLSIVCLAGVLYGTQFINQIQKLGLLPATGICKSLQRELAFGSECAKEALASWKEKQKTWKEQNKNVRHLFCASPDDGMVQSMDCALPYDEAAKSDYQIYTGQSHVSIIAHACDNVMKWLNTPSTT